MRLAVPLLLGILRETAKFIEENDKIIVALSGAAVAAFTGTLWWSTKRLWKVTKEAAEHIPRTERAYVFGGPGIGPQGRPNGKVVIGITMANYGKTPAFLKKISWGVCPETEWPKTTYDRVVKIEDVLFPEMKQPMDTNIRCEMTGDQSLICYGRFDYTDVFGNKLHSGWQHRMTPPHWHNFPLEGAYTNWS